MQAERILETCLYATDLNAAERFYTEVLGLAVISKMPGRHIFFRLAHSVFLVFNPDVTEHPMPMPYGTIGAHGARGPGHACFMMTDDQISPWRERLKALGVPIESEIDWPQGGHSIYFRDPAGNSIELATPALWGLEEYLR